MKRAVLDANVVISGTIAPKGASAAILDAWRAGRLDVVTCPELIAEIAEKLALPRIRDKYSLTDEHVLRLLDTFEQSAHLVPGDVAVSPEPSDPDDVMLFAAAIESNADYIVTGDSALLAFEWPGAAEVVSPREFLERELQPQDEI